jgi:hypothetical protein
VPSESVNTIVLVLVGFFIGVLLQLAGTFSQPFWDSYRHEGQTFWQQVQANAKAGEEFTSKGPRVGILAMAAVYGMVGVLVATLVWGPLELRWLPLLSSVLAGFWATQVVFALARRRKLEVRKTSFFDQIFSVPPSDSQRTTSP